MKSFQKRILTIVHFGIMALAFLVISVVHTSCDDKKPENPPVVQIVTPTENEFFGTVDTITVVASINHNRPINWIGASLLDSDFIPLGVETQMNYSAAGSASVALDLVVDKPLWESGSYYIAVRASDGELTGKAYVKVKLIAIERVIDRYIVVTKRTNKADVYAGAHLEDVQKVKSFSTDLRGVAFNYKENIVALAGGEVGDAVFYDVPNFNEIRVIPGFGNPSIPYFQSVDYFPKQEKFLLTDKQPMLTVLDKNAQTISSFHLTPYFLPRLTFAAGEHIFVDQKGINTPDRLLGHYYYTGYLKGSYLVSGDVKNVSAKNDNEAFLWLNTDSGTRLDILNYSTSGFQEVFERQGEELYDVVEISKSAFLFSTSQGLYRYVYGGGMSLLNNSLQLSKLFFDDLNEIIYGVNDKTIYQLALSGQVISSHTFDDSVTFFGMDYNR